MPQRLPLTSVRIVMRAGLLGSALLGAIVIGAVVACGNRIRADNISCLTVRLPDAPAPTKSTRLLVFAPHCDDETLGCAGLIQQTLAVGGRVRAAILTNGDSFQTAVECRTHNMRVGPNDYIGFATLRQQESYAALGYLGVRRDAVQFLGYPDRGLQALWNDCWLPSHPYTSPFTRCNHSPYGNTFTHAAPYCGQGLVNDIKANLRAFRPTLVAVTHPAEDHGDHAAAGTFVARALQELRADPRERAWASHARLLYYLVHRGDWPTPMAAIANAPLAPPASMTHTDTRWLSLPLTPIEVSRKAHCIDLYPSQTAMSGYFLHAFARRTELFGEITVPYLPTVADTDDTTPDSVPWESLPPVLRDPGRDNMLCDVNGGADVTSVYACRDTHNLFVRLRCRQPISSRYAYVVSLRPFGPQGETPVRAISLQLSANGRGPMRIAGARAISRDNLDLTIPLSHLQASGIPLQSLALSVETALFGLVIDKTGYRIMTCRPPRELTMRASN